MARITAMAIALDVMDRPWEWGKADCCTAACDVFLRMHGIDPMTPLRGQYSTRADARKIILNYGGFLPMAKALAAGAGLLEGLNQAGEIGVARDPESNEHVLAICIGGAWACKTDTGMATARTAERYWRAP